MLLNTQIRMLTWWITARHRLTDAYVSARDDERGDVPAQLVLIVILVAAALTVGAIITAKMVAEANKISGN